MAFNWDDYETEQPSVQPTVKKTNTKTSFNWDDYEEEKPSNSLSNPITQTAGLKTNNVINSIDNQIKPVEQTSFVKNKKRVPVINTTEVAQPQVQPNVQTNVQAELGNPLTSLWDDIKNNYHSGFQKFQDGYRTVGRHIPAVGNWLFGNQQDADLIKQNGIVPTYEELDAQLANGLIDNNTYLQQYRLRGDINNAIANRQYLNTRNRALQKGAVELGLGFIPYTKVLGLGKLFPALSKGAVKLGTNLINNVGGKVLNQAGKNIVRGAMNNAVRVANGSAVGAVDAAMFAPAETLAEKILDIPEEFRDERSLGEKTLDYAKTGLALGGLFGSAGVLGKELPKTQAGKYVSSKVDEQLAKHPNVSNALSNVKSFFNKEISRKPKNNVEKYQKLNEYSSDMYDAQQNYSPEEINNLNSFKNLSEEESRELLKRLKKGRLKDSKELQPSDEGYINSISNELFGKDVEYLSNSEADSLTKELYKRVLGEEMPENNYQHWNSGTSREVTNTKEPTSWEGDEVAQKTYGKKYNELTEEQRNAVDEKLFYPEENISNTNLPKDNLTPVKNDSGMSNKEYKLGKVDEAKTKAFYDKKYNNEKKTYDNETQAEIDKRKEIDSYRENLQNNNIENNEQLNNVQSEQPKTKKEIVKENTKKLDEDTKNNTVKYDSLKVNKKYVGEEIISGKNTTKLEPGTAEGAETSYNSISKSREELDNGNVNEIRPDDTTSEMTNEKFSEEGKELKEAQQTHKYVTNDEDFIKFFDRYSSAEPKIKGELLSAKIKKIKQAKGNQGVKEFYENFTNQLDREKDLANKKLMDSSVGEDNLERYTDANDNYIDVKNKADEDFESLVSATKKVDSEVPNVRLEKIDTRTQEQIKRDNKNKELVDSLDKANKENNIEFLRNKIQINGDKLKYIKDEKSRKVIYEAYSKISDSYENEIKKLIEQGKIDEAEKLFKRTKNIIKNNYTDFSEKEIKEFNNALGRNEGIGDTWSKETSGVNGNSEWLKKEQEYKKLFNEEKIKAYMKNNNVSYEEAFKAVNPKGYEFFENNRISKIKEHVENFKNKFKRLIDSKDKETLEHLSAMENANHIMTGKEIVEDIPELKEFIKDNKLEDSIFTLADNNKIKGFEGSDGRANAKLGMAFINFKNKTKEGIKNIIKVFKHEGQHLADFKEYEKLPDDLKEFYEKYYKEKYEPAKQYFCSRDNKETIEKIIDNLPEEISSKLIPRKGNEKIFIKPEEYVEMSNKIFEQNKGLLTIKDLVDLQTYNEHGYNYVNHIDERRAFNSMKGIKNGEYEQEFRKWAEENGYTEQQPKIDKRIAEGNSERKYGHDSFNDRGYSSLVDEGTQLKLNGNQYIYNNGSWKKQVPTANGKKTFITVNNENTLSKLNESVVKLNKVNKNIYKPENTAKINIDNDIPKSLDLPENLKAETKEAQNNLNVSNEDVDKFIKSKGEIREDLIKNAEDMYYDVAKRGEKLATKLGILDFERAKNRLRQQTQTNNSNREVAYVKQMSKGQSKTKLQETFGKTQEFEIGKEKNNKLGSYYQKERYGVKTPAHVSENYGERIHSIHRLEKIDDGINYIRETFGEPINGDIKNGYVGINEQLFANTIFNRLDRNFYDVMSKDAKNFVDEFPSDVKDRWMDLSNSLRNKDGKIDFQYQVPEQVFKKMILGTEKTTGKTGAVDYIKGLAQWRTDNFKRRVLFASIGKQFGDLVGNAGQIIMKSDDLVRTGKNAINAFKIKDSELPVGVNKDNLLFGSEREAFNPKQYTGNEKVDATLNLISGHKLTSAQANANKAKMKRIKSDINVLEKMKEKNNISKTNNERLEKLKNTYSQLEEEANKLQRPLDVLNNTITVPNRVMNKVATTISHLSKRIEGYSKKFSYLESVDQFSPDLVKNVSENITKQNELFSGMKKEIENNPELLNKILDNVENTLGNYSLMTPFEQNVMKLSVPFYAWFRTISRYMYKTAKSNPVRLISFIHSKNKLEEENAYRKDYQKLAIPLRNIKTGEPIIDKESGQQLCINIARYLPTSTFEELTEGHVNENDTETLKFFKKLGSAVLDVIHPAVRESWEGLTGRKQFLNQPIQGKNYRSIKDKNFKDKYVDIKNKKIVDYLPVKERAKYIGWNWLKDAEPFIDNNTLNLNRLVSATQNKIEKGNFKSYDKAYDYGFGGTNVDDLIFIEQYQTKAGKNKFKVHKELGTKTSLNTKIAKTSLGGMFDTIKPLKQGKDKRGIDKNLIAKQKAKQKYIQKKQEEVRIRKSKKFNLY